MFSAANATTNSFVHVAQHCVSLAGPSLAVSKNAGVVPSEAVRHHLLAGNCTQAMQCCSTGSLPGRQEKVLHR